MPRKGGLAVLEEIKRHADFSTIPVIGYSTSNNPSIIEMFVRLGGIYFFQKPDDPKVLVETLRSLPQLVKHKNYNN